MQCSESDIQRHRLLVNYPVYSYIYTFIHTNIVVSFCYKTYFVKSTQNAVVLIGLLWTQNFRSTAKRCLFYYITLRTRSFLLPPFEYMEINLEHLTSSELDTACQMSSCCHFGKVRARRITSKSLEHTKGYSASRVHSHDITDLIHDTVARYKIIDVQRAHIADIGHDLSLVLVMTRCTLNHLRRECQFH